MIFLKLAAGLLFFILGWIYLYKSSLVLAINKAVREVLFNDRRVLLERKKLAISFFCLSFIALYMGFSSLADWVSATRKNSWVIEPDSYLMYMAMQDYCTERYQNAIEKYLKVLQNQPDNLEAVKRLAYTYDAAGEKKKARALWKRLLKAYPENKKVFEKIIDN